jgi:hypothetical protein
LCSLTREKGYLSGIEDEKVIILNLFIMLKLCKDFEFNFY